MDYIQPLEMEKYIVQILSGSTEIFTALFMFTVAGMAGYFRMNGVSLFLVGFIGLLLFQQWIDKTILLFVAIFAGLVIGYWTSKLVKQ